MGRPFYIHGRVYQVGGPEITVGSDAAIYLIDCGSELVLIDAGAGRSTELIVSNIAALGFDPYALSHIILTHCHIDHVGSAQALKQAYNCRLVAHALDAIPLEEGDQFMTAASSYGVKLEPMVIDHKFDAPEESLSIGDQQLHLVHTPGHSPGSICVYLDTDDRRVLFGQDIHGPFARILKSDIDKWRQSMQIILNLAPDILCEGHFGIYSPAEKARAYIQGYLDHYADD